ncbi:MAG: hypothetical protein ABEK02_04715 [Haloquadratum sp.]
MIGTERDGHGNRLSVALATLVVVGGVVGLLGAGAGTVAAASAGSTSVRLAPTTATVAEGGSQTFDIVVSNADGGVGAVTATISVGNTDVAAIRDVELHGDPGVRTVDVARDGSKVFVRAALMDTDDTGRVTIGTVTIAGAGPGTSDVSLAVSSLGNETGSPYDVGTTPGSSLTVEGTANAVALDVSASASAVQAGDRVTFTVRRADSDARVSATVTVGGETYETGLDGRVTVEITESMASDADTVTAVASKADTASADFQNASVTLDLGAETETPGTETPGVTPTPAPGEGVRVVVRPANPTVPVGELTKLRVVATNVDGGVGAIEARVSLGSQSTARIAGATLAGGAGVSQTNVTNGGTTAVVRGALMDTADTGTAHVATVTVEGVAAGTSAVDVAVSSLGDEQGNTYEVAATPATTLTVGSGSGSGNQSTAGTSTVVLSVANMPAGFERASVTVTTSVEASVTSAQAELVSNSQLRVVSDGPKTTTVQAVDLAGNVGAIAESRTIARLTYDRRLRPEQVDIRVEQLQNDEGASVAGDHVSVEVNTGGLFGAPLPGADAAKPPTDPDGDGLYEDVNGDGAVTFDDAVALSFVNATELRSEQVAALDFDGDGDLDIDDAVALAFE